MDKERLGGPVEEEEKLAEWVGKYASAWIAPKSCCLRGATPFGALLVL